MNPDPGAVSISWMQLAMSVCGGGLALFLYGLNKLRRALKMIAGSGMRKILWRMTDNRFKAAFAGAFIAAAAR